MSKISLAEVREFYDEDEEISSIQVFYRLERSLDLPRELGVFVEFDPTHQGWERSRTGWANLLELDPEDADDLDKAEEDVKKNLMSRATAYARNHMANERDCSLIPEKGEIV